MVRIGFPQATDLASRGDWRQGMVGHHPACSGERLGFQELVEKARGDLDVSDTGACPTLERTAIAGASRGDLMNGERSYRLTTMLV